MDASFEAIIKDGNLTMTNPRGWKDYIRGKSNGRYNVVIKKYQKPRSSQQNRYMHLALKLLADELGYEAEEMKDLMKSMFLVKPITIISHKTGKPKTFATIGHTSRLTTMELEEFMRKVRGFGDEMGIYIPLPEEVDLDE